MHKTNLLGVCGGDTEEGEELDESMAEIRFKKIANVAPQV